jgi:hypothetical protein
MFYQVLHIMMAMCCIVLDQNETMQKQFTLFTAKSWPYFACKTEQ